MANYLLTNQAAEELKAIYEYSILNFGIEQARNYLNDLHNTFDLLAENPLMGVDYGFVLEGYRRHVHNQHVIYYKHRQKEILISHVLGLKQDQSRSIE